MLEFLVSVGQEYSIKKCIKNESIKILQLLAPQIIFKNEFYY